MRYYLSEYEAYYMDAYQGQFSRKMAEWAISMMMAADEATGKMKRIVPRQLSEMEEVLKENDVKISDEAIYTAWYLFNMCYADYKKSLEDRKHIAIYIGETINDPDGTDGDVLACFVAKMCNKGIAIHWDRLM